MNTTSLKHFTLHFTLPLTIISFLLFTKWYYVYAIDAKNIYAYGFPLIHKCQGFHTSMSSQYFLFEMAFNFLCYFLFWLAVSLAINRIWKIFAPNILARIFYLLLTCYLLLFCYSSYSIYDDRYKIVRGFDVEIYDSGVTILKMHSRVRD